MAVKRDIKSTFTPTAKPEPVPSVEPEVLEVEVKRELRRSSRTEETRTSSDDDDKSGLLTKKKKVCIFCTNKDEPKYWDANSLRRHTSDRGRINGRGRTGLCAKHQRRLSRQIKYARHLAMLPFKVSV
jgi:small subunit ribosomal protein S18